MNRMQNRISEVEVLKKLSLAGLAKLICRGGGGGVHAGLSLSLCLPSRTKLQCMLQLIGQVHSPYFISTTMYSVVEPSPDSSVLPFCLSVFSSLIPFVLHLLSLPIFTSINQEHGQTDLQTYKLIYTTTSSTQPTVLQPERSKTERGRVWDAATYWC